MKRKKTNLKEYISNFKDIMTAQIYLHLVFVIMIIAVVVAKYFNYATLQDLETTYILLIIFSLWLMFTSLYKQNQVFNELKKLYKESKRNNVKL